MRDSFQPTDHTSLDLGMLPYGRHQLILRVHTFGNPDSILDQQIFELQMKRPFFLQWWFLSLMGLIGIGLIGFAIQWRTNRLNRKNRELEKAIGEKTRELQKQKTTLTKALALNCNSVHLLFQ